MASMVLFALFRAQEMAKAHKTRALIAKLDQIIKDKWQTYQYRRMPVNLGAGHDWNGDGDTADNLEPAPPREAAKIKLDTLHDLMRMELPDRYTDIVNLNVNANGTFTIFGPADFATLPNPRPLPAITAPSVRETYRRRIKSSATIANQGAEMLYLIVMAALAGDEDSRDVFKPDNIGDTDGDGMPEFIDGWGRPIKFLRWAPGIDSDLQVVARGTVNNSPPSGSEITVQVTGAGLSQANGAYVGGAMGIIDPNGQDSSGNLLQTKPIIGNRMARITGYTYAAGVGTFTCAGAPTGDAFNGTPPDQNDTVVIMAPDPFDPTDAQRYWSTVNLPPNNISYYDPDKYVPSFAIYPLIYSAGPDGQFGILADIDDPSNSTGPYSYPANAVKPFVEFSTVNPPHMMFGASTTLRVNGVDERPNASLDNIHNHLQGLR